MNKAFLFDLNGTIIDDMAYHSKSWFDILNNDLAAGLTKAQVDKEMYGKNSELLERIFGKEAFTPQEIDHWSVEKEKRYQTAYRAHMKLINGLDSFLESAHKKGIPMAIGSAAIPFNISFILDGLDLHKYFPVIVSADDVVLSKPDPETFLKGAAQLNIDPAHCIVFEDAPKGVEAAANAGMKAVVITTMHTAEEFSKYDNIIGFIEDYTDPLLEQLLH